MRCSRSADNAPNTTSANLTWSGTPSARLTSAVAISLACARLLQVWASMPMARIAAATVVRSSDSSDAPISRKPAFYLEEFTVLPTVERFGFRHVLLADPGFPLDLDHLAA